MDGEVVTLVSSEQGAGSHHVAFPCLPLSFPIRVYVVRQSGHLGLFDDVHSTAGADGIMGKFLPSDRDSFGSGCFPAGDRSVGSRGFLDDTQDPL